jgi:hypothetical protein
VKGDDLDAADAVIGIGVAAQMAQVDVYTQYLPPYPVLWPAQDPRVFANHVRRQMAAVMDVPLVDASHDDYLDLRRQGVRVSWDGRRVSTRGCDTSAA